MRPVDADSLIEECHWVIRSDGTRVFVCHVEDIENAPTLDAPTLDAVPVVRCKDCKYWGNELAWSGSRIGVCDFFNDMVTNADGYCYRAVRKEDENETERR